MRCLLLPLALLASLAARAADIDCPAAPLPPTPAEMAADLRAATDHGFLWKVTKDGHSSYLFGTIHAARREWMYPGPQVRRALDASDSLAVEIDILDPPTMQSFVEAIRARTGQPIAQETLSRLRNLAQQECAPGDISALPVELQLAELESGVGRREGLHPFYGIDLFLSGWARGVHWPVYSLESPVFQLDVLHKMIVEGGEAAIKEALGDFESGKVHRQFLETARVWADGDMARFSHYFEWCDCLHSDQDRRMMKLLNDDRNPGMAGKIDALHAQGHRVFAAVGSLHMLGPVGIPALLAGRGYQVEPVNY